MKILVGSTIPAFKMTDDGHWWHWLDNAEQITWAAERAGHEVTWLAVLQHDGRGRERFGDLRHRLGDLKSRSIATAARWFSLDLGDDDITSGNRLIAICTGRNLISEYAMSRGHGAVYFADSDIEAPDSILVRLTEMCWPVTGAHVPTYGLDGPNAVEWALSRHRRDDATEIELQRADQIANAGRFGDTRLHWNTAGSLLMTRDAFRRVPWRYDLDAGLTDDPATQTELARLGWPTLVRHDVICRHHPGMIGPVEERGHDLAVYR